MSTLHIHVVAHFRNRTKVVVASYPSLTCSYARTLPVCNFPRPRTCPKCHGNKDVIGKIRYTHVRRMSEQVEHPNVSAFVIFVPHLSSGFQSLLSRLVFRYHNTFVPKISRLKKIPVEKWFKIPATLFFFCNFQLQPTLHL